MNKKGFTLLELLAVIVVLAIVAIIAVPIVLRVINTAKEGSAIDSAYGYIDSVEKSVALGQLDSSKGIKIPSDNILDMNDIDKADILDSVKIKGTKPDYVELLFERSKVKTAGFCIDGYSLEYKNKKVEKSDTNYCNNVTVKELKIKNEEILFNGNNGNLILTSGKTLDLDIEVVSTNGDTIEPEISLIPNNTNVVTLNNRRITASNLGMTTVLVKAGIRYKKINVNVINDSILGYLEVHNYGETGEYQDTITANNVSYSAHVYNYQGNQTWTTESVPNGGSFGSDDDIATSSENAKKMVIIKVDGDLTIESGVTILPHYTEYGGPKGFLLYVTGTLTNNGTIDNSHGAKADGQDVYLWQNGTFTSDADKYEVIPATGASGGGPLNVAGASRNGVKGSDGTDRKTAGGGCGYGSSTNGAGQVAAGGTGTSYSGGTGSGTVLNCNSYGSATGSNPSSNGGAGGSWIHSACGGVGGVGNPTPSSSGVDANYFYYKGTDESGTGGLLVIYANNVINNENSAITAKGVNANYVGQCAYGFWNGCSIKFAAGSSGGGSINIFYRNTYSAPTTLSANGGVMSPGGSGGNGSITIGSIATGTFVTN